MNNNNKIDIFALRFKYLEGEKLIEDFNSLNIENKSYFINQCLENMHQSQYVTVKKYPINFFENFKKLKLDSEDLSLIFLSKNSTKSLFLANNHYKEYYYKNYKNETIAESIRLENFEQLTTSVKIGKEMLEVIKIQPDSKDNFSDKFNRYVDIYQKIKSLKTSQEEHLEFMNFFIGYFDVNQENIQKLINKLAINIFEKFYIDLALVSKKLEIFILDKENISKILLRNNGILENILTTNKFDFYNKLLKEEDLKNKTISRHQTNILEKCLIIDEDSEYIINLIKNKKLKIPEKLNSLFMNVKLSQELYVKNTLKSSIKL